MGSLRTFPWPNSKGEPTSKLANFGNEVGATTPVGRYPDGATPEGLMDMAGNAWEWVDNWSDDENKYIVLRGGSWVDRPDNLLCVSRGIGIPHRNWYGGMGFRVVFSFTPMLKALESKKNGREEERK